MLAAAEFARRSELHDRAINTADRTRELHDFNMRYLAPYRDVMKKYVSQQQLDEAWVYGLIRQESRFIPDVKSSAGAVGLMQLMPETAKLQNVVDAFDPSDNIEGGVRHLKLLLSRYRCDLELSLAAYNAGAGTVNRARQQAQNQGMAGHYWDLALPNETMQYVPKLKAIPVGMT